MSQFVVFNGTGGGGGGDILTLTGNTGGAVSPDVGGNINVVGSGLITIVGDPGHNILTVSQTSQIINSITTADGLPHTILTLDLAAATAAAITANGIVIGTRYDGGNVGAAASGGGFSYIARLPAGSGATVLVDAILSPEAQDSATGLPGYSIVSAGTTVVVQVVGVAAQTWRWAAIINFVVV